MNREEFAALIQTKQIERKAKKDAELLLIQQQKTTSENKMEEFLQATTEILSGQKLDGGYILSTITEVDDNKGKIIKFFVSGYTPGGHQVRKELGSVSYLADEIGGYYQVQWFETIGRGSENLNVELDAIITRLAIAFADLSADIVEK